MDEQHFCWMIWKYFYIKNYQSKEHQLKNDYKEKDMLIDNARSYSICDILNQKEKFIKVMFLLHKTSLI